MQLTSNDTYNGHPLQKTPDTATSTGWWYVPDLSLHVKIHERWRAEIWLTPDVLHLARLRIIDHRIGAEWLDTSYPSGTTGATPFRRADQFMLKGQMPGWGEWPSEPTSSGPVPMPACHYCNGPVSRTELLVLGSGAGLAYSYPQLAGWEPRAHRSCHDQHDTERAARAAATKAGDPPCR